MTASAFRTPQLPHPFLKMQAVRPANESFSFPTLHPGTQTVSKAPTSSEEATPHASGLFQVFSRGRNMLLK